MKYGKRHESWKKASYIWEKDICDGEGQVILRDIRVMERGQSFTKRMIDGNNRDVWPKPSIQYNDHSMFLICDTFLCLCVYKIFDE